MSLSRISVGGDVLDWRSDTHEAWETVSHFGKKSLSHPLHPSPLLILIEKEKERLGKQERRRRRKGKGGGGGG